MKKLFALFLALICCFTFTISVSAESTESSFFVPQSESRTLQEMISLYVNNQDRTVVYNTNGEVMTTQYFAAIIPHYLNGDIDWIRNYTVENTSTILVYEQSLQLGRGLGVTKSCRALATKMVSDITGQSGSTMGIAYIIGGNYICDRATELVTSAYDAKLMGWYTFDAIDFQANLTNISTSARVASGGSAAVFSVSATVTANYVYSGVVLATYNMGYVTQSVTSNDPQYNG